MALISLDGNRFKVNQSLADFLGYTVDELTNTDIQTTSADPAALAQSMKLRQQVIDGEISTFRNERSYRHKDGHTVWGEVSGSLFRNEAGEPEYFVIHTVDITERKVTQVQADRLMTAINQLAESVVLFDKDDRVVIANSAWNQLNAPIADHSGPGIRFEDHFRAGLKKGLYPEAVGCEEEWLAMRMERHRNPTGPFVVARQDGRWIRVHEQRLADGGTVLNISDITELKQSEAQFHDVLDNSPIGVVIATFAVDDTELSGQRLFTNPAFVEMFGTTDPEQLIGLKIEDSWIDLEQLQVAEKLMNSEEGLVNFEARRRRVDGTEWWALMNSRLIEFNGQRCKMIWHADITDKKRDEEHTQWLLNVIDGLTETVSIYDHEDRLVFCNETFRKRNQAVAEFYKLGVAYEDFIRAAVAKGMILDAIENEEQWIKRRMEQHQACGDPFTVVRDDSYLLINEQRLPDGGIATLAIDLSAQMRAEAQVKSSEARLQEIFAIAPEAIITIGGDNKIQMFNASAERIFGYYAAEVIGRSINILLPENYRKKHDRHIENFENSSDTYRFMDQREKVSALRKDGTVFPAAASVSKLGTGDNKIYTVMLHDITARRKAENERRAALIEAKMANRAKSEFLATMSHELRTPLNAIIGFSEILIGQYFGLLGSPKYQEYAEDIHASGTHLLNLVNDILDLSAIEAGEHDLDYEELAISDVVDDSSPMILELARRKAIRYTIEVPDDLPPLRADRRAIKQILLNLLTNSIKFTPDGGEIKLRVSTTNTHHIIEVIDTGRGIPDDQIDALTKPFVRGGIDSHKTQEGTGLGLSIVNSLIGLHNGELRITSALGLGTTVSVKLPSRAP